MLIRFLFIAFSLSCLQSCYIIRAYKVRDFKLTDHQTMPSVSVPASSQPYQFREWTPTETNIALKQSLDSSLASSLTAAFLVIRNDSIIYENYFNGFSRESLLPSFSVAKSVVATLVGMAINEGKISSTQDPVTRYLPDLKKTDPLYENITLQHLLDMRSGLKWNEGKYGLQDDAIKMAFRPNLLKYVKKVKVDKAPGGAFNYQSINTELLALVVESATGKKLAAYLGEKLWEPLGMEYEATWNVDNKKRQQEIAFAGLNATARDYAKLGQLYLNGGKWKDRQVISREWVNEVSHPDSMRQGYTNQWWQSLSYYKTEDSLAAVSFKNDHPFSTSVFKNGNEYRVGYNPAPHANGILNQYVYFFPARNVVIVRLGRYWYHPSKNPTSFIYELGNRL